MPLVFKYLILSLYFPKSDYSHGYVDYEGKWASFKCSIETPVYALKRNMRKIKEA